jgi:hypothetical protein
MVMRGESTLQNRAIHSRSLVYTPQYAEAQEDPSRVVSAIYRQLRRLQAVMLSQPLASWAEYRWVELVATLLWMAEHQVKRMRGMMVGMWPS